MSDTRTIYLVKKNSDMTEGRGPMVVEAAYEDEEAAWAHANEHAGVMGRKPRGGDWRQCGISDWTVEALKVITGGVEVVKQRSRRRRELLEERERIDAELRGLEPR